MKRYSLLTIFSALTLFSTLKAQVNIGSTSAPQTGAVLQVTGSGTQGILGPNVVLTSLTTYAPVAGTATNGMLVYHTGGNNLAAGYYFWSNNQWNTANASSKALSVTGNMLMAISSIAQVNITAGSTADILGTTPTITLNDSSTVLITYSACPLPLNNSASVQGSINLMVDGSVVISSYYSSTDGNTLNKLGNYSTTQYLAALPAGTHTFGVQAKSWNNTTAFDVNPFTAGYGGSVSTDAKAMTTRLSIVLLPRN